MFDKRNVITLELLEYSWDIYFVSIGLWAEEAIFTHVWISRYETYRFFRGLTGS